MTENMAATKTKKPAAPKAAKTEKKPTVTAAAPTQDYNKAPHRRTMVGIVVSDKMMKTRVVRIARQVRDGAYGKITKKTSKFKFHDENNVSKTGDQVSVIESRPLSRDKRWALQKVLRSAAGDVLLKSKGAKV